jgi:carbon monoxide dehydrogenase subunit G
MEEASPRRWDVANDFEVALDVAAPPDATWALAGDPVRIHEWFPAVESVEVDGDRRTGVMVNGAHLVERLVDRDETARTYSYEIQSGIPRITSHRATISVEEAPGGSRVRWRQTVTSDVEGYDAEKRLAGVMKAGLDSLRERVEAGV